MQRLYSAPPSSDKKVIALSGATYCGCWLMKSTRRICERRSTCSREEETVPFTVDHSDSMVRCVSCSAMANPAVRKMSLVASKQGVRETNQMSCCSRANKQTGQS